MIDVAMLIVRVGLGLVFLAHGVKHARGRRKTSNWLASIGYRLPQFNWMMMTVTEIGLGLLLVFGLLTSVGVAMIVATMFVAFWTVHRPVGFWVTARPDEGWEYVFTLTVAAVALAIAGPGEFSVDHTLGIADDLDGAVGLALAVFGLLAAIGQLAIFWRPSTGADSSVA